MDTAVLSSLVTFTKGRMTKTLDTRLSKDDLPYLTIDVMEGGVPKYAAASAGVKSDGTDVLVVADGSRSGLVFYGKKGLVASTILRVSTDENKLDSKYLYYYTQQHMWDGSAFRKGSTVPHFNYTKAGSELIVIPELTKQRKVVEILSDVDMAIEATQETIEHTERLKSGLLNKLIAEKTENPPNGWELKPLSEVASVQRGKFSQRPRNDPAFYGGDIPFIQTGDVVASSGKITKYTQTLNEKGLSVSRLFPKGTIVMTIAANIGATAVLDFDSCFPDSLVGITPKTGIDATYLEYYLQTKVGYLNSIATQSAQKNINLEKLYPLEVLVPPTDEQTNISGVLTSIDEKIAINKQVLAAQLDLKRGLLEDLFSGKVQV
jgi:type I restriction enzyme S subunit